QPRAMRLVIEKGGFILTVNRARGQTMRRTAMAAIAASGLALTAAAAEETPTRQYAPADSTFSIIAVEKETGLLGLGVQSKALSIGNRVVTGKGGVAIVAHQSSSNPMYGKLIIDGIERGMTPQQALEFALRADKEPDVRKVAVIDIRGRSAACRASRSPTGPATSARRPTVCRAT